MKKEINLQNKYKTIISNIVNKYTDIKVAIFGSRSKGTNKEYSDVDLLILDQKNSPIDKKTLAKIKFDLIESNLPYLVDLHAVSTINSDFYHKIKENLIIL